ncbi:hypothetical protein [Variovorax paradoxus]|uniref:Class I SAM-dependent methyltransferase n=1 Tax=Variovorax paradoxus TaxID=34073 RepID=A0A679JBD2_VARPD|nr:hypothetical protein VVAX_03533 [Variovorax paradoxus]
MLKTFSGRRASQDESELRAFIALLQAEGVTRYAEIGAREGDTFHEVMTSLPAGAVGLACDLPGGLWGKSTTGQKLQAGVHDVGRRGYQVSTLLGDSTHPDVVAAVADLGPFDAILIDGDHTYDGVKADWVNYRDLAPVVAFHDIVGTGQAERVHGRLVEVPQLWAEIKAEGYRTTEFIAPGSLMGIGVVFTRSLPKDSHEL